MKMASMEIYFILILFFVFTSAKPSNWEYSWYNEYGSSESTTESDGYTESTTEPDVYLESTYETTEYNEEKVVKSYKQDQNNEPTNEEFLRNGYTYLKAVNHFYKIHVRNNTCSLSMHYLEAWQVCVEEGASLFYAENEDEQNAVMSFLNKTQPDIKWVFLGISDLMFEGVFQTIDGKSVSEVYNNWKTDEPNNARGGEDCLKQDKTGKMNDCNCSVEFSFICKKTLTLNWYNIYNAGDYTKSIETTITADTESDVATQSTYGGTAEYKKESDGSYYIIIPSQKNGSSESTTESDGYTESTTESDGYTESLTESDGYTESTYGTTEYNEEKVVKSNIQDQNNEPTNEEFLRNGYTHLKAVNHFYKIHVTHKTWLEAWQVCVEEGASLFYAENEDEQNAVMSFLNKTQPDIEWVFLGISDLMSEGVFQTIDGKSVSEVYNNWKTDEPNNANGGEDCVEQDKTGKMNDCNCLVEFSFICKKTLALNWYNIYNAGDYTTSTETTITADTESDVATQSTYGGTAEYKKETDGSYYIIIPSQKNVVTTSRPASDGSYIQVYQKNEYHNNGDPVKLVTVYKRCSENGNCKDIHHLEIALND